MTTATFKSYNTAVRFLTLITKAGISAKIVPLDAVSAERGCSYGVRLNRKHMKRAGSIGAVSGVFPERWL